MSLEHHPLLVREKRLKAVVGLSPSTVRRLLARGEFPQPIAITPSIKGWRLADPMDWIEALGP